MNRREFLAPRKLAQAAQAVTLPDRPGREPPLVRAARRAMATTFEMIFPHGTPRALEAATEALDEIDRVEALLSVYREDSEVARVNASAAHEPVPVSQELYRLVEECARLSAATAGAFDITAGPLVQVWGFAARRPRVPDTCTLEEARGAVGMAHVALDAAAQTVRFLHPDVRLNFGSIGKGYALDRAAACLRGAGVETALLHGGHSSVYAVGAGPTGQGWPVGIRHPWRPGRLAVVRLADQGLGTSASTHQHLVHDGRRLGHILDPRTGWPAEGVASASAIAASATEADALATAFYVLGLEGTRAYCRRHPGTGAVMLADGEDAAVSVGLDEWA